LSLGFDPTNPVNFGAKGYGHRRQHRLHQRRNHGVEKVPSHPAKSGKIYSTFKPPIPPDASQSKGNNIIFSAKNIMH
jgi:hypothetical protein